MSYHSENSDSENSNKKRTFKSTMEEEEEELLKRVRLDELERREKRKKERRKSRKRVKKGKIIQKIPERFAKFLFPNLNETIGSVKLSKSLNSATSKSYNSILAIDSDIIIDSISIVVLCHGSIIIKSFYKFIFL